VTLLLGARSRIERAPVFAMLAAAASLSEAEVPANGVLELTVPLAVPAGMAEAQVTSASLRIEAAAMQVIAPRSSPRGTDGTLALQPPPLPAGAEAILSRIEIDGLAVTPSVFAVRTGQAAFLPGDATPHWNIAAQPAEAALRFMLRPSGGSGFAPPAAAVPGFPMPGAGAAMYGAGLAGLSVATARGPGDRLDATMTPGTALPPGRVMLVVAAVPPGKDALPNEAASLPFAAAEIRAVWSVRQGKLAITLGDAPVATLPQAPPGTSIDFAPALRGALKAAIAGTAPLPSLRIAAPAGTKLRVGLTRPAVLFIAHPLPQPATIVLAGEASLMLDLPLPAPRALAATIEGSFGPVRLTSGSDVAVLPTRAGLVLAGAAWGARMIALSDIDRALPIRRVALFGRAAQAADLVVALHAGVPGVIGAALGTRLALAAAPSTRAEWHAADLPPPWNLPPHGATLWVVVHATRGSFLWHGLAEEPGDAALASPDGGGTWQHAASAFRARLCVHDPDGAPGAVSLALDGAVLAPDIAGGAQRFRHELAAPRPAELGRHVLVGFSALRDATLTISAAAAHYQGTA